MAAADLAEPAPEMPLPLPRGAPRLYGRGPAVGEAALLAASSGTPKPLGQRGGLAATAAGAAALLAEPPHTPLKPYCRVGQWSKADELKLEGGWRFRCTVEGAEVVREDGEEERFIPVGGACHVQCAESSGMQARAKTVKCILETKKDGSDEVRFETEPNCEVSNKILILLFVVVLAMGVVCTACAMWREAKKETQEGDDWR